MPGRSLLPSLMLAVMVLPAGGAAARDGGPAAGPKDAGAASLRTAPPLGLLEFCERLPETCRSPVRESQSLAREIDAGRRLAWREVLSGTHHRTAPAALAARRSSRAPAAIGQPSSFLGGVAAEGLDEAADDRDRVSQINQAVNRAIVPMSDQRLYGRPDVWAMPKAIGGGRMAGDCEDYVLAKREALLEAGVTLDRLSIALARTPEGEDHAVLLVAFPDGDYVLDNRDSRLLHWSRSGLIWQSRQRPGEILQWMRL